MMKCIDFAGRPFKLSVNALVEFEEMSGKSAMHLGGDEAVSANDLRRLVAVGLKAGSGKYIDLKDAGEIIDELGFSVAAELVGRAMEIAVGGKTDEPASASAG